MILLASIRRGSIIDKRWRSLGQRGGVLCGVTFSLTDPKRDYESVGAVPGHLWSIIRSHESVQVSVLGETAAPVAEIVPDDLPLSLERSAVEVAAEVKPTSLARPKSPPPGR